LTVSLIWAQARDRVIGKDGGIPWHLPEDMALFKERTIGSTVVMGRLTWESLPGRFRPLPGRTNLVVSRRSDWRPDGATVMSSVRGALEAADGDVWVIGGAQVYAASLPFADRLVVTEVDLVVDGDTYAPAIDDAWRLAEVSEWLESSAGLRYRVRTYQRAS
jgi:dihydrofolate reductase